MTAIRNIRRHVASATAAFAVSAMLMTAAAGPVNVAANSAPAAQQNVA